MADPFTQARLAKLALERGVSELLCMLQEAHAAREPQQPELRRSTGGRVSTALETALSPAEGSLAQVATGPGGGHLRVAECSVRKGAYNRM